MGSTFLRGFALGMNDEIRTLGRLAEDSLGFGAPNTMPQQPQPSPYGGEANPQDSVPASQMRAPSVQQYWLDGMIKRGIDPVFARGMMPNIGDESGWNTTIEEQNPISGRGGKGGYQLTGPRREAFEARYGNDWSDDNQLDFFAWEVLEGPERANYQRILKEANGDVRKAAAGIVNYFLRPAEKHRREREQRYLMSAKGTDFFPYGGEAGSVDTSGLEEAASMQEDPVERNKTALMGFFQGLGQMSRGETVDMSDVMNAYYARQSEARERLMQIEMEKQRQSERLQERSWQVGDANTAEANRITAEERSIDRQIAAEQRAEDATIRAEDRKKELLEQQAAQAKELYGDLVPNADAYYRVGGMDAVKDAASRHVAAQQRQEVVQKVNMLSRMYPDSPYKDIAEAMATDPALKFEDAYKMFEPKDDPAAVSTYKFFQSLDKAGQQAFLDYQAAGGTTFNIGDTIDTVKVKRAFEELGKDKDALRAETGAYQAYKTLAAVFASNPNGVPTGAIENLTLDARRYLADIGLLSPEGTANVSAQMMINSLGSRLIGSVRVPGTGSTSDLEFSEFMKAIPSTAKPEFVNQLMTQIGINSHRTREQEAELKEKFIVKHGDTVGFMDERERATQAGELQASLYSTDNTDTMRAAIQHGNLKAGDIIQGPGGQFMVLTQEGINSLLAEEE